MIAHTRSTNTYLRSIYIHTPTVIIICWYWYISIPVYYFVEIGFNMKLLGSRVADFFLVSTNEIDLNMGLFLCL